MSHILSPCSEAFQCINRNDDISLCHDLCPEMSAYRKYLDELFLDNTRVSGDVTYYNLPLAPPVEEGHVEDAYSSLLSLESIYHHKIEAEEAIVEESIDTSFARPLYNSFFKEIPENELTN